MRLRLALSLALLFGGLSTAALAGPAPPTTAAAAPPATTVGQFKVFNVSLALVKCTQRKTCTGEWKTFFQRLADKEYRPDVVNILEVPFIKKDVVLDQLAAATGTDVGRWGEVHSDKGTDCTDPANREILMDCGNNMVVWHYDKFAKLAGHRFLRTENVNGECDPKTVQTSKDVAVALQEKDLTGTPIAGRILVSAAVHYPNDISNNTLMCLQAALDKTEADLDSHFDSRPLTVVSGDYNEAAFKTGGEVTDRPRRREVCLDDWYRSWSVPVPTKRTDGCTPEPGNDFAGAYLDVVRWKHYDDPEDQFCWEWTYSNLEATDQPGLCTSGKNRIDFMWIRRESSTGMPVTDASILGTTVLSAGTDRGYYQDPAWSTRYSDHRALEALLAF
ncbi:MAG: hypothetical protein M3279_07410 [Actinomycetota bacterium]|nr:hypothetical protein [Actinomycetota bacterium]